MRPHVSLEKVGSFIQTLFAVFSDLKKKLNPAPPSYLAYVALDDIYLHSGLGIKWGGLSKPRNGRLEIHHNQPVIFDIMHHNPDTGGVQSVTQQHDYRNMLYVSP